MLVVPTLNVHVKLTDSPGARLPVKAPAPPFLLAAAVQLAQLLVPVTLTLVSVSSPVLVSVTVRVTLALAGTGLAGDWLTNVRLVAGWMTSTSPETVSLVSGAAAPSE